MIDFKDLPQNLQNRITQSVDNYMVGYNCCQSILVAFADLYGYSPEQISKVGSGFGGGIGGMHYTCGVVSALVILAGLDCGSVDPEDKAAKAANYRIVRTLVNQYKDQFGSVICSDLLGLNGNAPERKYQPTQRTATLALKKPCTVKVECAARIFAEYIYSKSQE